jgi:hypothetical protein
MLVTQLDSPESPLFRLGKAGRTHYESSGIAVKPLRATHNSVVVGSSPTRPTHVCVVFTKPHAGRQRLFLTDF